MSVVEVRELREGEASLGLDGFDDRRVFEVELSAADSTRVSLSADGIPRIGEAYNVGSVHDVTSRVVKKTSRADPVVFTLHTVTVMYQTIRGDGNDPDFVDDVPPDPLAEPPEISRDHLETTVPAAYEIDDDGDADITAPIQNSASQPFPTPPEREIIDEVITITRNESSLSDDDFQQYNGALNDSEWHGRAANTCRMKIATRRMREYGVEFEKVTYIIEYRRDGWFAKILDEGYVAYDSVDEEWDVNRDAAGMPLNEPKMFDGSGQPKLESDPPTFLSFQLHQRADYDLLDLPAPDSS